MRNPHRNHPGIPKSLIVTTLALVSAGLVACTSPDEKIRRVMTQALEKCNQTQGDFYDVPLFDGTDEILRDTCSNPPENLKIIDEYHASVQTGPYEWLFGVNSETGVWVLSSVRWKTMTQVRQLRSDEDLPKDALERGETLLKKVQDTVPTSTWIRKERLQNILDLRHKERPSEKGPGKASLGAADPIYQDFLAWCQQNEQAEVEVYGRTMVISYFSRYQEKIEISLDGLGSQDEWLESLIKRAVTEKDKENREKYAKELADRRIERPKIEQGLQDQLQLVQANICRETKSLSVEGIDNKDLKIYVRSLQTIDCKTHEEVEKNP
jgi:hypothetical protein